MIKINHRVVILSNLNINSMYTDLKIPNSSGFRICKEIQIIFNFIKDFTNGSISKELVIKGNFLAERCYRILPSYRLLVIHYSTASTLAKNETDKDILHLPTYAQIDLADNDLLLKASLYGYLE